MKKIRVLMVEDSEDDAELIRLELGRAGFEIEWQRVETAETFLDALRSDWDLIICDFQMPRFNGLRAFALFKEQSIDVPFIFVSGALGEDRAVEAMLAGARDYVLKGNLTRLDAAVRRELTEAANRDAQRGAEALAEREQRRLTAAVEASGAGVFEYALPERADFYISDRCLTIVGCDRPTVDVHVFLLPWLFARIHADDLDVARLAHEAFVSGVSARFAVEVRLEHEDGRWIEVALFGNAVSRDAQGHASHVVGVMLDLTDQRALEAQLRQAQKMDAVGRLAGGVAHDFNNLLTAIFTFGRFVLEELKPEDAVYDDMQEVLRAADKAAELTSQLLAFSRLRPVSPRVLNVNDIVEGIDRMLRRIVGEDIDVQTVLAPELGNVRVDRGSFEQVIVNLAVNGRDAMPDGGKLTIETANVELDESYLYSHGRGVKAGAYVALCVSDDGIGMDEAVQTRIFEPFFTTKVANEGTGLGLATCYGIVQQAGGYIWVYSEVGHGTTFKVYLPRVDEAVDVILPPHEPVGLRGTEVILLAEDDHQVRKLAVKALSRLGYKVIEASNGAEAVERSATATMHIDMLLTDVVMPEMSGRQLVEHLTATRPHLKVLYMSGYTPNAIVHRGVLEEGTHLLQKPFTPATLARKVREVLDK